MGDGGTAGENVGSPWGATSKGVGSLMRRDEREHWQPCEVRRASTGAATSKLVLEVLAASRNVRSPPSVDGGAAQKGEWRLAGAGGVEGADDCSRPAGGVEDVAAEWTHNLEGEA